MRNPRNWRLRFSLRALLFAMLLVGLLLGWLVQRANHNRGQRKQVERVWRIGGAVSLEGAKPTDVNLPVFPDEWQAEAKKGWFYDACVDCRPLGIIFPNHIGIKNKTSDADLDELIDALRQMPTVKQIWLLRMFHSKQGALKVKQAFPEIMIQLDLDSVLLPDHSTAPQSP